MVVRLHTFLFADLVGFTRFTARHGDERAADVATAFQHEVGELAAAHRCQLVKSIGDGVMVRGEDPAAAIALAARIIALADGSRLPQVRVGLDTGPAVRRGADWFGSTVNTASRVTTAARAGELLVTERAREACAGDPFPALDERGRHGLRGLPDQLLFGASAPQSSCVATMSTLQRA
jgi:adenylate cyclase